MTPKPIRHSPASDPQNFKPPSRPSHASPEEARQAIVDFIDYLAVQVAADLPPQHPPKPGKVRHPR